MQTGATTLLQEAAQNNSYAGAFAYESNTPMKVFMGQRPNVPLEAAVNALSAQHGSKRAGSGTSLGSADIDALRMVIGMDVATCSSQCTPVWWDCLSSINAPVLSDKIRSAEGQVCQKQAKICYQSCLKQGGA